MEFILRPFVNEDLESLVLAADNFNIARNMTNKFPHPYNLMEGKDFIEIAKNSNPIQIFAIIIDNKVAGATGIFPQTDIHCKNAEMGYWLSEPLWRKGIISEVIPKIVDYGFKTWDINRIFA